MGSTGPDWDRISPAEEFGKIFSRLGLPYALIGGYAVCAWSTPRATDDFDFVVLADREAIKAVEDVLVAEGFAYLRRQDAGEASGPDFIRMMNRSRGLIVDLQVSKTDYQDLIISRAVVSAGGEIAVATAEDIVVLKLIAGRSDDQKDINRLVRAGALDWVYMQHWAEIWRVADRLQTVRDALENERPGI